MKILVLFLLLAFMVSFSHADTPANRELASQISDILKEWSKLKPGITRAELLKVFTIEGGISTVREHHYVSRRCPYVKIDVQFTLTEPNQKAELPTDTIQTISKPYLEWSIAD